ncbi:MAG: hypothetical protein OHK0039_47420 [Bacteroidia bacterium]
MFGTLGVAVGLYPLLYFLIDRHFGLLATKSEALLRSLPWNAAFYGHIVLGGVALAIGWMQFSRRLRVRRPVLHRRIGRVYVLSVLVSGMCGIYIGYFATGGLVSSLGFVSLGVLWLAATAQAYTTARRRDLAAHAVG